jgi:hypothetical protein
MMARIGKRRFIGFALLGLLCSPAAADYGQGDSASFPVDLLTIPTGGAGHWADSSAASLNLLWVNRGWSSSSTFFIGDPPYPAPTPVTIECPTAGVPGTSFTVRVILRNNGGPGDHGGVSISFPDLEDPDAAMPPYESAVADVAIDPETTFTTVGFFDTGDSIDIGGTMGPAQHLLVEGDEAAWNYNDSHTLTLTVTPHQVVPLQIRIRTWIADLGTGYGPPTYRWPDQDGIDRTLDQQQYWSQTITVDVSQPDSEPGSVIYVGAPELHEGGVRGAGVKIGMLELALPWTGHEALIGQLANGQAGPDPQDADDRHATLVAGILVGHDEYASLDLDGLPYRGMALNSTLYSETVSSWALGIDIDNAVGALVAAGCEVVNYSGGIPSSDLPVVGIERDINRFVDENKVSIVVAVGNTSQGYTHPASPAQTYNVIAVGATGDDSATWPTEGNMYDLLSFESVTGPTASIYSPDGRSKPDLVSAGRSWVAYLWTGLDPHGYSLAGPSTSVAAPHVAGAVALLIEASRQAEAGGQSLSFVDQYGVVDPRAIKCALLTAADKKVVALDGGDQSGPTRPWQTAGSQQPLDFSLGAGGLNVVEAKQVLLGTTSTDAQGDTTLRETQFDSIAWQAGGTGVVSWTIGSVTEVTQLTATLVWNAHYDGILLGTELNNLDLYLMRDGVEVARSDSLIDNVEHIYLSLDQPGNYSLEIRYIGQQTNIVDPEPFAVSYRLVQADYSELDCVCGDIDGSGGSVDLNDFSTFAICFGLTGPTVNCDATAFACSDLDANDTVDLNDFSTYALMFGTTPTATVPDCIPP